METVVAILIPAIVENVFGALIEAVGLSDWLRQRLGRDPEKLAFHKALTEALTDSAAHYPGRDLRYFAEILRDIGGPLLARTLQPAAPLPTADELTTVWLNHLTVDSLIHYRAEFTQFATYFLDRLQFHLKNQQSLRWIAEARHERSSEEIMRRTADAAEQSATSIKALQQEVARLTATLVTVLQTGSSSTVTTGSGAYIGANVSAQNFAGRDLTIKNYFVTGLPRLVIDYSSRIQDFLLEYLGSKRKKVPFGGRQQQLAELNAWLDDSAAPPYYLMTAEAGRGKSALVCRWLAQLTTRTDLDVIFVPISIRFETATQDVVFAALAARLANLYENEPEKLPPVSLTAEQWKGVCQSYLRREPPSGKRLVVILDGLDEATGWAPSRSLFSADPPNRLRVLVTARTRPGENGTISWANILGWEDLQLARMATLPALERRGVEEALASMGNPLDTLATKVDIVGELHRLSEGDPLLVRLYVGALVVQGKAVNLLRAEDLHTIQPGLTGYFERWWQDQEEQWRIEKRDPIVEQANLRTLLSAIAAAMGPLTLNDLAVLHPDLGNSMLVRKLMGQVSRWLVGNGNTQGYSYSHPRLGYYFWEQLGSHERQNWDERFCTWGEQTLNALNKGKLTPSQTASYIVQYYAAHLERIGAVPQKFYALISNGWRRAWEYLDISYVGFLNDIERAAERARQTYDPCNLGKAESLVNQIKAVACQASVTVLSRNLHPKFLAQAVKHNLYTPIQALTVAKFLSDEQSRTESIVLLIPYLPGNLLEEVLITVEEIQEESYYLDIFNTLAPYLTITLIRKTIDAINKLTHEHLRIKVLRTLVPYLPDFVLPKALLIAQDTKDISTRLAAFSALLPKLPESNQSKIVKDALKVIPKIIDENIRAEILAEFAPYLKSQSQEDILDIIRGIHEPSARANAFVSLIGIFNNQYHQDALNIARSILLAANRVNALIALMPYLEEPMQREVQKELITAIPKNSDKQSIIEALRGLAPCLSVSQLYEIISSAWKIENLITRLQSVSTLLPHIPEEFIEDEVKRVISVILEIDDRLTLIKLLLKLACDVPNIKRVNIIEIALTNAQNIDDIYDHVTALMLIFPHLPLTQKRSIIEIAWAAINKIKDTFTRVNVLGSLIPYLLEVEQLDIVREAFTFAQNIEDKTIRTHALVVLAPCLSKDLFIEALVIVREIADTHYHIDSLVACAHYLSQPLLKELLTTVQKIGAFSTLVKLVPYLPEELAKDALNIIPSIKDLFMRAQILSDLAPLLPEKFLVEGLAITSQINNEYSRAKILKGFIPYLPESLLGEALILVQLIQDVNARTDVILKLIPYLPQKLLLETLTAARGIWSSPHRASVLFVLENYLPEQMRHEVLGEALAATYRIWEESCRFRIIVMYAPHLLIRKEILLRDALTDIQNIECANSRTSAFAALAPYLSEGMLVNVLTSARKIWDEQLRSVTLGNLIPYLPKNLLSKVLFIADEIWDERARSHILSNLAPYVQKAFLNNILDHVRKIKNVHASVKVIIALAPHLPDELLAKTLAIVGEIEDQYSHLNTIVTLAPHDIDAMTAAYRLRDDYFRVDAVVALIPRLTCWARTTPELAYPSFESALHTSKRRPRPDTMLDIAALMPFILALAGDEAPQAAEGIYQAIQEVCGWWP